MVIIHGNIHPMEGAPIPDGFLRFSDVILAMGPMEQFAALPGESVLDAKGAWVLPGLIDVHTHLGLFGDGLGFEGEDCNEVGEPVTPHLRVIDGINPMDRTFRESLEAGVTTVAVAPGSTNPIGGQIALLSTHGRRIDDMLLKAPLGMKFALGENPKTWYHDRDETPVTRMGTAAAIRQALYAARDYGRRKQRALEDPENDPPEFDLKQEALLPVLAGEIQAHFHAHRLDDIFTALRISREFSLDCVIVHGTEGYLAADLLVAEGVPVITGPNLLDRCKPELKQMTFQSPSVLTQAGVLCSICTDHPETPLKYLPICAGVAAKNGLSREDALRCITLNPAKIVGMDQLLGSLKVGKRADVSLFTGDPLEMETVCKGVFICGRRCF